MDSKEEKVAYYRELDFIRELENRNDVGRDQTLIQLSVGLFAVLATFGEKILKVNITLSYITFIALALTVIVLIVGFMTSSRMLVSIRTKMTENVLNKKPFYDGYTDTPWQGVNTFINTTAYVLFLISIISTSVLFLIYIGGLNGQ